MKTLNELLLRSKLDHPVTDTRTTADVVRDEANIGANVSIKAGQVYRHYKGGLYQIITWARHSETKELMIVYGDVGGENIWVRPARMWIETVSPDMQRFTLLGMHPPIIDPRSLLPPKETQWPRFWLRFLSYFTLSVGGTSIAVLLIWTIWKSCHV